MRYDAVVVGSGPNGLAAAVALARAGRSVLVREAQPTAGGGMRTLPLTLPGYRHDLCSAIHPLAVASPFFSTLPLAEHGLSWIHPDAPLAHPLDDAPTVLLERGFDETAAHLDPVDREAWRRLHEPLARSFDLLVEDVLRPLVHVPRHPLLLARFGALALMPGTTLARTMFSGPRARALFGGSASHALVPLSWPGSASFGLVLSVAGHAVGWPFPRGGSQALADALVSYLRSLGGEVVVDAPVEDVRELDADKVFFDVGPKQLLRLLGDRLPAGYRRRLEGFRYGPGTFKLDWALSEPIPWRDPATARAATVHLGGTLEALAEAEHAPWLGKVHPRPYVLLAQPSLWDDTRAPAGRHTAWAYCHVPNGSDVDATELIEAQVERFAPGFRDTILARAVTGPSAMQAKNANLVGGDISGGANTLGQILARPVLGPDPYRIPGGPWWLCSASTPPGGGVHGMCGVNAVQAALGA